MRWRSDDDVVDRSLTFGGACWATLYRMYRTPLKQLALMALPLSAIASGASAQEAGDTWLLVGAMYGRSLGSETAVHTELNSNYPLLGIPQSFDTDGLSAHPRDLATLVTSVAYFVTDRISIEVDGGYPPVVEVEGRGIAAPPGPSAALFRIDLGDPQLNPLMTVRQWSPIFSLQFLWGDADDRLRPFAALGATYTWFTQLQLDPEFEQAINDEFGRPLALNSLKPGPTSVRVSAPPLWAPAVKLGVSYTMTDRWGLLAAAVYAPYSGTTTFRVYAADGTLLGTTRGRVNVDASGLMLAARYAF
ncbi:OmpW/AlkL family protein [Sinimarinibacterium sp. CAU 1509]|uniref:OmpW/AlkL family protein n=1 Tax=Sinimarinibacterium sp. CAU 1509 TaxID=2562283 RepID=UPI00146C4B0F|nr:OmpW family protein [Sinimarinibacterium sp. CAU 1509]